jgi:acetyl esterase/lipase
MTVMKKIVLLAFLACALDSQAQTMIPLYDGPVPNSKPCGKKENNPAEGRVAGIISPSLYVYQPAVKDSMKTAVIICPGGGYARLAIDHEGFKVAEEFNKRGVTAFVLKYRNPLDSECVVNKETVALEDAQMALYKIRNNAKEFGINPNMLGMMGFSAGGHLTSTVATHFASTTLVLVHDENPNLRPDFIVLGYPVISFQDSMMHKGSKENMLGKDASKQKVDLYSNELQVTPQTPPTFLLHAADDKTVKVQNSLLFYQALLKNKVPCEMHLFQSGGHGFGLNNKSEPINWLNNVFTWMTSNKFMKGNVQ